MEKLKKLFAHKIFKILAWVFLILVVAFYIQVITRIPHVQNEQKTNAQVVKIHETKLTLSDVMGKNLPPDPVVNPDATVQGVDANNNGIRDDVELAIFKEYPNSAKTRAVLLQYALALQMETIQPIVNENTATEVVREQSRAFVCIGEILSRKNLSDFNIKSDVLTNFVKEKMFNTSERKKERSIFVGIVKSYSDMGQDCDLDLSTLPN